MQSINMPVWAISTGNEPLNGVIGFFFIHFMSMGWTPWQQVGIATNNYTYLYSCFPLKGNLAQRLSGPDH